MAPDDWENLVLVLCIAFAIAGGLALITVQPRGPLTVALFVSAALSVVIYLFPPGIHGREDFQPRLTVALFAALAVAAGTMIWFSNRSTMRIAHVPAVISASLLGAVLPVIAVAGLILAVGGVD